MTQSLFDIVHINGQDSFKFLQSQLTADLNNLDNIDNKYILSAYCNRQGQVISVFYIAKSVSNQNAYTIITLGNTGSLFINKIKKYAVFSKVEFAQEEFNSITNIYNININIDYYIANKIPIITKETSEKYLPNELGLIEHKAVSLKKGCFLGQEIIARVYYKGKPKRNLCKLKINTANNNQNIINLINPGTDVNTVNNNKAGEVLVANNINILAIIEDRYVEEELYINSMQCVIAKDL